MICDEIENFEDSDSEDSGEEVFQDCMECGSPTSHGISLDKANSGGTDGASPDTDPTHTTSGTATDSTAGSGTSENSTAASTENTSGTPTSGTSDTASEREHDGAPADSGGAAHNDASSHGDSSGPPGDGDEDGSSIKKGKGRRAMRNWMNSLGATPRVKYIYEDLKDGLAIIQLFDKIQNGCVNWKKVNTPPFKALGGAMKQIENCNYAIDLGHNLGFVLVGIDGKNLHDGDKLTLGLVWQMMRHYTLAMLTHDGKIMKDNEIIKWCNDKLAEKGKTSSFSSFKDASLGNSRTIVDLIDAISPGYINYDLVTAASTDDEKFLNARYAITMARKIGARIFALPEDITEVNPKMIMTVFACLMSVGFAKDQQKK